MTASKQTGECAGGLLAGPPSTQGCAGQRAPATQHGRGRWLQGPRPAAAGHAPNAAMGGLPSAAALPVAPPLHSGGMHVAASWQHCLEETRQAGCRAWKLERGQQQRRAQGCGGTHSAAPTQQLALGPAGPRSDLDRCRAPEKRAWGAWRSRTRWRPRAREMRPGGAGCRSWWCTWSGAGTGRAGAPARRRRGRRRGPAGGEWPGVLGAWPGAAGGPPSLHSHLLAAHAASLHRRLSLLVRGHGSRSPRAHCTTALRRRAMPGCTPMC